MKIREIPQTAIEFIFEFEGFRDKMYRDVAGFPTIGIGHLIIPGEKFEEPISLELAKGLLASDLRKTAASIMRLIRVPLTGNQYSALLSFTFNLGGGALQRSTLRSMLNLEEYDDAADEFPKWCMAGGRKVRGLLRRRLAERALFLK